MIPTILTLLCALFALLTLLPLWNFEKWWVRVWDFPRLQLAVLLLGLILANLCLLDLQEPRTWILTGLSATCLVYQLWWILPYTRLWKPEVLLASPKPKSSLRVLAVNVLTPNKNAEGLISQIRQWKPDLFVALETDKWWEGQFDRLEDDYPHSIKCPLDNLYGMHVYSRLLLNEAEISYLVKDDIPSMHAEVMLENGVGVRVHFLHPEPPSPTENEESLDRDVELLMTAKSLEGWGGPTIVTGDLNDVAWSKTTRLFRKLSGLLDPRVGRGMFNTFHADHWFLRWPLDHLFHSAHFKLIGMHRLERFGSDHFPVLIELNYEGDRGDQEGLDPPDREERELAQEKLAEKQASADEVPEPGQS